MQLSRTKYQKSFILSTKKWIRCFPGKNPVNSREKSGDITCCAGNLQQCAAKFATMRDCSVCKAFGARMHHIRRARAHPTVCDAVRDSVCDARIPGCCARCAASERAQACCCRAQRAAGRPAVDGPDLCAQCTRVFTRLLRARARGICIQDVRAASSPLHPANGPSCARVFMRALTRARAYKV